MRKINASKKAVSLMISYVLLILIAFSIGILVYFWINNFVTAPSDKCPDGVSLIIRDAMCNADTNDIIVNISNKGRFKVHGFVVRGSDNPEISPHINLKENDGKLTSIIEGLNMIESSVGPLEPNEQASYRFNYDNLFTNEVVKISVGAIRVQDEMTIVCENTFVTLNIECL